MTDAVTALSPIRAGEAQTGAASASREAELFKNAQAFEAVFVAQMLAHTGLGKALASEGGFGGEAFSSLLIEQYANRLVEQGGFGLTEQIYEQLRERDASHGDRIVS